MTMLMIAAYSETQAQARRELNDTLTAMRNLANHLRQQAQEAAQRHRNDITLIGEKLIQEANERQWCREYDRFVEELNDDLERALPLRERDFEITVAVELRVDVTATNEDHARELAQEIVDEAASSLNNRAALTAYPEAPYDYEVEQSD